MGKDRRKHSSKEARQSFDSRKTMEAIPEPFFLGAIKEKHVHTLLLKSISSKLLCNSCVKVTNFLLTVCFSRDLLNKTLACA